ncbi:MAG: hypothetical protein U0Q16_15600 [Bryobacteraceae bacterium]
MASRTIAFDPVTVQRLFGHEAADDENPARLKEYYVKNAIYREVTAALPLRIVVGHKGIGKSALFKISIEEDRANGLLPILIRPDDIAAVGKDVSDFLLAIRAWKEGLAEIITNKALAEFGMDRSGIARSAQTASVRILDFLAGSLKDRLKVDTSLAKNVLLDKFLKSNRITVYLDDLDRGWEGKKEDVKRLSALLNAVRDLSNDNPQLFFKIGLRSDVYYLVRTADESTDKLEGSVVWQRWSNHEILVLLVKRIETFFGRGVNESQLLSTRQHVLARYLDPVMDSTYIGSGHWANAPTYRVLMSLIRKRPRDLVKLLTLAAKDAAAANKNKIGTANFQNVFAEYSEGRIQDTINEYRSEMPDVERLIMSMKPSKKEKTTQAGYVYTTQALFEKLKSAEQSGAFRFASQKPATPRDLATFLYKINFLTARKEGADGIIRKYFEESRYLSSSFVDFGFDWEIHPAYRWALQPDSPQDIFSKLRLSADDD